MTQTIPPLFDGELPRRGPAVAAMFLSGLLFAVMSLCAKAVGSSSLRAPVPASEVTLIRFSFSVLVMLPFLWHRGARLLGTDKPGLFLRGISGGFAVFLYFVAIASTALTNAVLLNLTSVVFAPLFSLFILRERLTRVRCLALGVATVGIVLLTRPTAGLPSLGDAAGLASGVLSGLAITSVRRLRQGETAASIFFYFSLIGLPIAASGLIFERLVWPTATGWWLLLAMSVSSVVAQLLMTYGYRYVTTGEGVLMTLSQIVYSALAGTFLFREAMPWTTLVGGILILGAAICSTAAGHYAHVSAAQRRATL